MKPLRRWILIGTLAAAIVVCLRVPFEFRAPEGNTRIFVGYGWLWAGPRVAEPEMARVDLTRLSLSLLLVAGASGILLFSSKG